MVLKYAIIIFLMLILLALCLTDPIYEYTMKKYNEIMNEEKEKDDTESKGD